MQADIAIEAYSQILNLDKDWKANNCLFHLHSHCLLCVHVRVCVCVCVCVGG